MRTGIVSSPTCEVGWHRDAEEEVEVRMDGPLVIADDDRPTSRLVGDEPLQQQVDVEARQRRLLHIRHQQREACHQQSPAELQQSY